MYRTPLLIFLLSIGCPVVAQEALTPELPLYLRAVKLGEYGLCLRNGGPSDEPATHPSSSKPFSTIGNYAETMEACYRERDGAILKFRAAIKGAHPDWSTPRVEGGAEKALTQIELAILKFGLRPEMTSHGPIDDY